MTETTTEAAACGWTRWHQSIWEDVKPLRNKYFIRKRRRQTSLAQPPLVQTLLNMVELSLTPNERYNWLWKENEDGMKLQLVINIKDVSR